MKNLSVIFVLISIIFTTSCVNKSGNLIGEFKVIYKESFQSKSPKGAFDAGWFMLESKNHDTIRVAIHSAELFFTTKVGKKVMVRATGEDNKGFAVVNNKEGGRIGYCKIVKKCRENGVEVITKGGDTLKVSKISHLVYFNSNVGDSVFVKRNKRPVEYYVE